MLLRAIGYFRRAVGDLFIFGPGMGRYYLARLLARPTVEISLKGIGPVLLRPNDSDMVTFRDIFRYGDYDIRPQGQKDRLNRRYLEILRGNAVPIIIDAGANVGAAALWFAKAFPSAQVWAIEPDANNAAVCRQNTEHVDNIVVLQGGIGCNCGSANLAGDGKSWAVQTIRSDDAGSITIHSVQDVMDRAGANGALFIVKVDIEGFESDLFAENIEWIADAAAIYVEPHDWLLPGKGTSRSMQRALFGAGFEILLAGENLVFVRDDVTTQFEETQYGL